MNNNNNKNNISINFNNLNYTVKSSTNSKDKQILKEISGNFRGNELTAIIGPSGSGKTSLLNVLSGFQLGNISGDIKINGSEIKSFRKEIAYVMQESLLQEILTVNESMRFAIKLKTCSTLSSHDENTRILDILKLFSLDNHHQTRVKNLSGGQRKRLSIALEIVDNPKIIFLDECTTGLDASSSLQCIKLLQRLVCNGKTIICTIHQATTLMMAMFDHIYAMADGNCIYQGSFKKMLTFLKDINLECPQSYNPIDHLMEIANDNYGEHNQTLCERIQNGKNELYCDNTTYRESDSKDLLNFNFTTGAGWKFIYLMQRNFLILRRDFSTAGSRLMANLTIGLLVGLTYGNIGNDAQRIFNNFRLIYATLMLVVFTSAYSQIVYFPTNYKIIKRECFNRWYTTRLFNIALLITDIPITIASAFLLLTPIYLITNQPREIFRFSSFLLILILLSFNSNSIGLLASCVGKVLPALVISALLCFYQAAFSGIFILKKDALSLLQPFFQTSFLKYANDGLELSIMGFNRSRFDCHEIYCHFQNPAKFLQSIEFDGDFNVSVIALTIYMIVLRILVFTLMSYKIKAK